MRFNLTNKLFVFFIIVGIGGVLTTSLFSFHYTKKAIINRAINQLTSVRVLKKKQIENFFFDRTNEIKYLTALNSVSNFFNKQHGRYDFYEIYELNAFLNQSNYSESIIISDFNKCLLIKEDTSFYITNKQFYDIPDIGIIKKNEYKIKLTKDIIIEDFQIDSLGNHSNILYITAPVFVSDSLKGMLMLNIKSDAINNIMFVQDSRSGLGESGESYLVGDDFFMRSSSRFENNAFLNVQVKTKATESAFKGNEDTEVIIDYRNVKVLSSYSKLMIKGLNWVILTEIDFKEIMLEVGRARKRILFISLLICLIILPISYLFAGKITHPILKLNYALIQVGEGSFDVNLETLNNDEIGSLTSSFNLMTQKLKQQSEEVKEREERLQHFHDATKDAIILHSNNIPVLFNQAAVSITGYNEDELKRITIDGFLVLKGELSASQSPFKNVIYETKLVKKNQELLNVEIQENTIEYKGNYIKALVIRDISRRKKAEKAFMEEREKRMSSLIDGQEMERVRLSRELHDSLGQYFIAIKLKLESIIETGNEKTDKTVSEVKEHFDIMIDEVRRISNNLMPAVLYEFGIQTALSNLCKRVGETASLEIRFYSDVISDSYNSKVKTYIYRIAQEALNNCVKHSDATLVNVYLLENSANLKFIIKDNGKGFNFDKNFTNKGKGLNNMKDRAELIHAVCEIRTQIGAGTEIYIEIPRDYNE